MKVVKYSVLSILLGASFASGATETGTLTITGNVVDQTCEVPAAQLIQSVTIPEIGQAALTGTAENAAVPNVSVPLQFDVTNCPASVSRVGIRFDYTADGSYATYMQNTGSATGVLLGISKDSDTTPVASATSIDATNIANGAATVSAKVNAYRTSAAIAAGDIASTATVTVNYD